MAAFPVDAQASLAELKPLVALRHRGRQAVKHLLLLDRCEQKVAVKAQRERMHARRKLEPLHNLHQLRSRLERVDIAAVRDNAGLEQLAVTREDDTPLVHGLAADLAVRAAIVIE